jgi:uncharacterized protein YebE (UPF0316 family)
MNIFWLCVTIFFVRIVDTSLATIRTILTVKNKIVISSIIAFFEIFIWFLIVREAIITTNNSIIIAISYSLGFAVGTFLGIIITDKYITSVLSINIVINNNNKEIIKKLRENGFAMSISKITGKDLKNKDMLFVVTTNKRLEKLKRVVISLDKNAFIAVSENKYVYNGFI